jgi:hypothetical protein
MEELAERGRSKETLMAYEGFDKLKGKLAKKGVDNPGGLAAFIGRKKYGAGKFNKAAAAGKSMKGMKPMMAKDQAAALKGKM